MKLFLAVLVISVSLCLGRSLNKNEQMLTRYRRQFPFGFGAPFGEEIIEIQQPLGYGGYGGFGGFGGFRPGFGREEIIEQIW
ncbi:unnamed protein product [Soboliphyme baturini]|uniref:Uncharacterized protein n=1 Tax=Soboliphyme baturini TaxID=241478 RepID=A0A183IX66_9BILA|nr:unnamed protein product [Soboliphyme baturini]